MFDISWTDPKRETVGERKNRKVQQNSGNNGLSRTPSARSAESPEPQVQHSRPGVFSRLGGKKANLNGAASSTKLSALRNDDSIKTARRVASYTAVSELSGSAAAGSSNTVRRIPESGYFNGPAYMSENESQSSRSSEAAESVFSARTTRSAATASSWGSLLDSPPRKGSTNQPLSPRSFITRTFDMTPLTLSPRASMGPTEEGVTVGHISTAGTIPIQAQDSPTRISSSVFEFPMPHIKPRANYSTIPALGKPLAVREVDLPKSPSRSTSRASNRTEAHSEARPDSPALGSPISNIPESWSNQLWSPEHLMPTPLLSTQPLRLPSPPFLTRRRQNESSGSSPLSASLRPQPLAQPLPQPKRQRKRSPLELSHLQRQIRRMEAASTKIILERLKEEWVEIADASVYRELELEKQRWMLFALRDLKNKTSGNRTARDLSVLDMDGNSDETRKVLSLFENHASASFLSALSPTTQIHHLSSTPLSPKHYPNVHPLLLAHSPSIKTLPYPSNSFSSITSFSLPSLLPASSLPTILAECHRILIPGGTLHLTVLDPSPLPSTLGPKLRAWLDDHLLLHLERQFCPLNPSRLFPAWLQDVGLRSEGSTRLTVPFLACVNPELVSSLLSSSNAEDANSDAQSISGFSVASGSSGRSGGMKGKIVVQELKSVVGRMLWKEMWGGYVQGDRWWWEDRDIVEECEELKTCWSWEVLEGVKSL